MNWKRLLCLCLALALALTLGMGAASAQELKKLTVSEPVHLIGYLPLYVAIHEGYFAQEGLEVNVVQGHRRRPCDRRGQRRCLIDIRIANCLANQGNSDPVVGIVNCVNRANVYLFARKGLAPASDSDEDMAAFLKGKTIIAGRYGGSPNLLTRYLLQNVGLDPIKT